MVIENIDMNSLTHLLCCYFHVYMLCCIAIQRETLLYLLPLDCTENRFYRMYIFQDK